jgi:hypothetical protein
MDHVRWWILSNEERKAKMLIGVLISVMLTVLVIALLFASPAVASNEMNKSQYRGKWFDSSLANCREAIMRRESNFNYKAANRVSSARGAYQFLDNNWRESLVHILRPEIKKNYPLRRDTLEALVDKPIHKWPAFYQDAAWYTVVVKHDGLKHWSPVPRQCY